MNTVRCSGCGKTIEAVAKAVRVTTGKVDEGAFSEAKEWGIMHEECFDRAVDSPAIALAKIRKLAKQTVISTGKKSKSA